MVEEVVRAFAAAADKITMVPNGVDPRSVPHHWRGPARIDAPLIVSWGRLEYEKGFQTLIAAVARLVARRPAFACALVGRGTTPRSSAASLAGWVCSKRCSSPAS